MRALAIGLTLLGGCMLVPPSHPTSGPPPSTPSPPTTPSASSEPSEPSAPATTPPPPPSRDAELPPAGMTIKRDRTKVLIGMTLDQARAQLQRWGYHGEIIIEQSVVNSDVPNCDDRHVCGYAPVDLDPDEPLIIETRKSVKIAAPPPP